MHKEISVDTLYIPGSVQRNYRLKTSNEMQQYADIYLLINYCTCFGRPSRPSSGVYKTVVAASGTDHTIWEASFFKRYLKMSGVHVRQLAIQNNKIPSVA